MLHSVLGARWAAPLGLLPITLFIILFLLVSPAVAEEREPVSLEETVITADPFGRTATESTQPARIVHGEELRESQGQSLGETLANQPGVNSADFSAGASRPVIRGLGGPRVRVLENGSGVIDASTVSPDHNTSVEPFRAQQIEILKGPATLLYGSGAIGGVVNVVSDLVPTDPLDGFEGGVGARYSTVDEGKTYWGSLDTGTGPVVFHMDALRRSTDDYEIPGIADADEEGVEEGVVINSDAETDAFSAGFSWVGDNGFVGIGVTRYESNYGIPGHHHEEEHHDEDEEDEEHEHEEEGEEGGVRIDLEQTRVDLRGGWEFSGGFLERVEASWVHSEYEHMEIEPEGAHEEEHHEEEEEEEHEHEEEHGHEGTVFSNEAHEFRVEAIHAPMAGWRGVFGMQTTLQEFSATGEEAFLPPVDTNSVGIFLIEERQFGNLRASLGGRAETVKHDPDVGSDVDFDLFSASAGLHWDYAEDLHFSANLGHAERAPDVQELFSSGPHLATSTFERGNVDLDTESALSLDIGVAGSFSAFSYEASVFITEYSDFIFASEVDANNDGNADFVDEEGELEEDGELLLIDFLQEDAQFVGYELGLNLAIDERHDIGLFSDYVRAKLDGGDNLPRIPAMRVGMSFGGEWAQLSYGIQWIEVLRQTKATELEGDTDGYSLLSADVSYTQPTPAGDVILSLRGRNLLDEEARNHVSFVKDLAPLPGANVIFDVEYRFGL